MNDALPTADRELLLEIISDLPRELDLSTEIGRADISNSALAGGCSCDVYCATIPWVDIRDKVLVTSRCRLTENERSAGVLKVAIKRARTYILNTLDPDNLLKFMKVGTGVYDTDSSYDALLLRDMLGKS